jgi:TRAP-type C4-dicarboxylate transport system permease small subunit
MKILTHIDNWLGRLELGIVIFLLGTMIIFAFLQVVLRNIFSTGIVWVEIFLRHDVLWLGFLGGALATGNQRHIKIDAVSHLVSERNQAILHVITNLFAASICIVLTQASMKFVGSEIEMKSIVFDGIPAWYAELIIPIGFALHSIHFIFRTIYSVRAAIYNGNER